MTKSMRIVLDLQGAQTESRFRGIGRYCMALAKGIARNRGEHELIVVLSGLFPETIDPIIDEFEGLLPRKNILVWQAPGPVRAKLPANEQNRRISQLLREAFLANLRADVIHVGSLFEGFVDDAVTSIGLLDQRTPVSISFYDLIPLLNREQYLSSNACYEKFYLSQVAVLQKAALFLSISEFAKKELLENLPIDDSRVVNVSTAADPMFFSQIIDPSASLFLKEEWAIEKPFLLYTGGADERKNLGRLLEAFASLPQDILSGHQLVLAGKFSAARKGQLQEKMRALNLSEQQCIFTGYISNEQLVILYNLAKAFIFASWHEGFGIPPLEAMQCGIPVIASNRTSIPEVVGLAEALFDPFDIGAMTVAIERVLTDEAFRSRLIEYGSMQARLFSWDASAQRAIASFEWLYSQQCKQETLSDANNLTSWPLIQEHSDRVTEKLISLLSHELNAPTQLSESDLARIARDIAHNEKVSLDYQRWGHVPADMSWKIEGPFDSSYSLALVNREVALALEMQGQQVVLHSSEGPGDFDPNPTFLLENPGIDRLYQRSQAPQSDAWVDSMIVSRFMYPPRVGDVRARFNLLHGYAWEETGYPAQWVANFNDRLQGISVCSQFVKKVLIDNGVRVPIAVTRLGVDHLEKIVPQQNYALEAKRFRFLHVSSCFPRKGIDVLLNAYGKSFTARDDVTLVIKTFSNPHNNAQALLAAHRAASPDFPDVQILEEDISEEALKALYLQCHALVAPSRAEGFGFPMAEAMLLGLAVITTNWGGHVDFCKPHTSWLVDYQFELANTHLNIADSVWALPNEDDLAKKMLAVFSASLAERQQRSALGRQELLAHWTWKSATASLIDAAHVWARGIEQVRPRIAWISSINTRCGIAKYSEHLLEHFPVPVQVFAPNTNENVSEDAHHITRCWNADGIDPLVELTQAIDRAGSNCIVIQFNYGFFSFSALSQLIEQMVAQGKKIFITLHATIDPPEHVDKQLRFLRDALALCDRILVHSVDDLNRLKGLGLVDNVALFPHGIFNIRRFDLPALQKKTASQPWVIASYGFFLPHKGLLELIDAFAFVRQRMPGLRLRLVNAQYPIASSAELIELAKQKVAQHQLGDCIEMHTDFLSDRQSLTLLRSADLVVFPYQQTGESSSAAVRHGLASEQPVAVTPLAIFSDVGGAVHVLPGFDPRTMANGLIELIEQLQSGGHMAQTVAQNASIWRKSHQYSAIARRFHGIISACLIDRR